MSLGIEMAERGWLPDPLLAAAIRARLRARARSLAAHGAEEEQAYLATVPDSPIALHTESANDQHYEVPAAFFERVLGPHLKYSCCYYPHGSEALPAAEAAMLQLTAERAGVQDGMDVLDLGCGWGSFTLWAAQAFPGARFTAVSNSNGQRAFIEARARARGLGNVHVRTADMNTFDPGARFDRVVSVEMFEHMRNHPALLRRIHTWLQPEGRLFVHVFCHKAHAYPYQDASSGDWMARHFFTGGMMPSYDLFCRFDDALALETRWAVNGEHYARTSRQWLVNLDAARAELDPVLRATYGAEAARWLQRWRMFFLAVAEFFAHNGGEEWFVGHYRFRPQE